MIRRYLLPALLIQALASGAWATEPIRFARTPDVSPDGKSVAFSYLGDIWLVSSTGGVARPVTLHESHDFHPVFSPDGRSIAFSSKRHGNYDVFVVPVEGGRPTRLTFDSGDDLVCGWSPDGQQVLYACPRLSEFPPRWELSVVPVGGGRPRQVSPFEGRDACFGPDGKEIVYVRGPGSFRKGYRGSSSDDLWIGGIDGTNSRQLTSFNGQDSSPCWSPDGKTLFFVSEMFGNPANVVRQELASTSKDALAVAKPPQQVTFHKDDSVRKLRLSGNGDWLVYECGADLWLLSTKAGQPRKLLIEAHADDKSNPERVATFASGATEMAVSPDEKHVAFVVQGEIFLVPRAGGTARRLTNSPADDHGVVWARDGKSLFFLSDRNGHEDIYRLDPDDPEHPELVKAHQFKPTQLTNTSDAEMGLNIAPDGKRLSFLRGGQLWTMNLDGSDPKAVVPQRQVIDYEWSPNSKWLCYARVDGSFGTEMYIAPATGATAADPARNITRYATFNAGITWSRTGNRIAFLSERSTQGTTVYTVALQKPGVAGAAASEAIDWDDIHFRAQRVVNANVGETAISGDGTKVAFRGRTGTDEDLYVANVDGSQVTRLTTGNLKPKQITWSRFLSSMIYFVDGTGGLRIASTAPALGTTTIPAPTSISYKARLTIVREEEYREVFDQSWRALHENFYDPNFHGVNWKLLREKYRDLVKHVAMKEDLYALVTLMLGELNASHLGISGPVVAQPGTAELGLVFDPSHMGAGLKVREIIKRGPADRRGLQLTAGDVILKIDGRPLTDRTDLGQLLQEKAGETVVLHATSNPADPKATRRLELQPVARSALQALMYDRWAGKNFQRVTELSKGKLGYIHIPRMDDDSLDRFLRSLFSDNFEKEALVLDVRFNGGGYTHEKILNYLGGKEHTFFYPRHGGMGPVLNRFDRKWTRPVILLINNRSYSDAEIFPSAFRAMGLGKLVGQATGGFVIGTRNIRLIDGSEFRVPRVGVFTPKGINMDKEGVAPDVMVEAHPDDLAKGIDAQLDRAVEVLLQDLASWKKTGGKVTLNTEGLPGISPAPVTPELRPTPERPAPPAGGSKE